MLAQLVKNIKNHVKAMTKNEGFVELFDIDNNSVIFYVPDYSAIEVGVEATPDGEFTFADGMKVVIEGGLVQSVEKAEAPVEETAVEETPAQAVNEEMPAEEAPVEEDKDAKIAELEAKVAELAAQLEEQKQIVEEKEEEIKTVEEDLKEIQNFYTKVNKTNERTETKQEVKTNKKSFCFIGKK